MAIRLHEVMHSWLHQRLYWQTQLHRCIPFSTLPVETPDVYGIRICSSRNILCTGVADCNLKSPHCGLQVLLSGLFDNFVTHLIHFIETFGSQRVTGSYLAVDVALALSMSSDFMESDGVRVYVS
jgi:hypothetical protein